MDSATVLIAPHVVSRAVPIVEPFGNRERAGPLDAQVDQRKRIELAQRYVPGHLEFARVAVVIGHFQPLDVEMQRLAGQQALMAGIPVVELDELGVVEFRPHQFLFHRRLGAARRVAGETIILVVEAGELAPHPVVELRVGELVLQERQNVLRLLDLGLDVLIFVHRRPARRSARR